MNQIKAQERSDEDAIKVVNFLIEHQHTSPLESVTLSFSVISGAVTNYKSMIHLAPYIENKWARIGSNPDYPLTMDLLNFLKVTVKNQLFDKEPWKLFKIARPELSELCLKFKLLGGKTFAEDVSTKLGEHSMQVELVDLHRMPEDSLSRATWRIKCPLSISVQILRHRAGSFNQTSGRYRTILQEVIEPATDCIDIFKKIDDDYEEYLKFTDTNKVRYRKLMKKAKEYKDKNIINNEEYKRLRENSRFILPEGRMTEIYATFYLDDFYKNYLPLRNSEHAQIEHIWIAQEMEKTLAKVLSE